MGQALSQNEPPPRVVLVPPLFERDLRLRSRMAHSSYDYMFGRPALRFLLEDYMQPSARGWLNFRPSEDPRVSVSAVLDAPLDDPRRSAGAVNLRYQPDPEDYLNFFDVKAAAQEGGVARARACIFDKDSGFGAWASLPLVQGVSASNAGDRAKVGLRYSSPQVTSGLVISPTAQTLEQFWLAGQKGAFSFGVQTTPVRSLKSLDLGQDSMQQLWGTCQDHLSYAIAYSPTAGGPAAAKPPGRGSFTAAIEVRDQQQMLVSFLYHMAVQRNVRNPFEDQEVVAITNYLDVGLQVATDVAGPNGGPNGDRPPADFAALGVAWQANKSVLVKGKVGTNSVGAALAFKSWWHPSCVAAVSATWLYGATKPKLGLTFGCENHGNIRYERSKDATLRGKSVMQRHVALPTDIANKEGKGLLVRPEEMDNPEILGQVPRTSDQYL